MYRLPAGHSRDTGDGAVVRKYRITIMRHLVRSLVMAVLFFIAGLNYYYTVKSQHGGQEVINRSASLSLIDKMYGTSPHRTRHDHFAGGSLWSFQLKGFRASDPLAVLGSGLTSKTVSTALLVSLLLPIALTVLLGRFFCGWICPMGVIGEGVIALRRRLERLNIRFFNVSVSRSLKYYLLVAGAVVSVVYSVHFFYIFYPPRIMSDWVRDWWTGALVMRDFALVAGLSLVGLLACERLWCKCLCPGAAVYSMMSRWRLVRVQRDKHACTKCGKCDVACPYDLDPSKESLGGECDNCGQCIEVCGDTALSYRLGMGDRSNEN